MTAEQALAAAAKAARAATISPAEWARRVRTQPGYRYQQTAWWRALLALDNLRTATAEPPPPPPPVPWYGQRVVFFGAVHDDAVRAFAQLGPGYTAAFTADPNPAYRVTPAQVALARQGGGHVMSWADCMATPYSAALAMYRELALDGACGQYEDDSQYEHMLAGGTAVGIGNPAGLGPANLADARERSRTGRTAFIGEVLHPDPTYSGQGVQLTSVCFYVDRDAAQGGYLALEHYAGMPAGLRRGCCIYTGSAMRSTDWATYAAWTRP